MWRECSHHCANLQSWTKMLRKMHVVCLILEYFPLNRGHSRYFPIYPPPPKNQCWSVAGTFLFPTKQHWPRRGGGRGHHGAKFAGWVSYEKESEKFLTLSVQDCCYLRSASGLCHRKQCLYITALKIWFTSNLLRKNMIVTVNCFTSDSWLSELGNELLYSRIDRCT